MDPTPTTARLFACEPTPAERAEYRAANKAAAVPMFDHEAYKAERADERACPACGGIGDRPCTCHRTGAAAVELDLGSCPTYDPNCLRCRYATGGDHRHHVATRTTFDRAELEAAMQTRDGAGRPLDDEGRPPARGWCDRCGSETSPSCTHHSAQRGDYRLTADDETAITARIAETIAEWRRYKGPEFRGDENHRDALVAVGLRAIGCVSWDMRASELEWLAGRIARELDRTEAR